MKFLILCLLLIPKNILVPHDYHIAIFDIELKSSVLQISQKLFVDDFEKAIMLRGQTVSFGENLSEAQLSKCMQDYILDHFIIKAGDNKIALSFIGAEWIDFHALYLHWESAVLSTEIRELEIFNDIFLEVNDAQQNMHHFKSGPKNQSLFLDKLKTQGIIKL